MLHCTSTVHSLLPPWQGGYAGSVGLLVCLSVCLSVCMLVCKPHCSKTFERIMLKCYGRVKETTD